MKVRIKKTGVIVNLADYAVITLDSHDSWGNPIEMKPEDVEFIQETGEDEHWQDVRERAAIAALNGLLSNHSNDGSFEDFAKDAVSCADALVKQLKDK